MRFTVQKDRDLIITNGQNTQNENEAEKIILEVPEEFEDFNKKIVFITPNDEIVWDIIVNNEYLITNAITQYEKVEVYVWLTNGNIDFRTKTKLLPFYSNKNASEEITPEEISGVNTVINFLEEEITKVENMDIDAVKIGDTATITITDKNGISKTVEVKDGQVSESQIQEIIQIVQSTIQVPEDLADLSEDSVHRTVTDNEKSTWNNKQNALVSGTNIKTINNQSILGEGNLVIESSSGTTDYSDLENKPKINNVELNGNKSLQDLGINEVTEQTVSGWGFTKNTGTYNKPSGGIPKTDLENSVQTSLGKADTALQIHQDISGKLNTSQVKNANSTTAGDVYDVRYINTMIGNIETLLGGI